MNIIYRSANSENLEELTLIAQIDSKIPCEFDTEFFWNPESVTQRLKFLQIMLRENDFLYIAEEKSPPTYSAQTAQTIQSTRIVGFYAIKKQEKEPPYTTGMIITLWVSPSHRHQGIGRRLKEQGEKWAKELNLKYLETAVHLKNGRMLSINLRSGYEIVQHRMRKTLK